MEARQPRVFPKGAEDAVFGGGGRDAFNRRGRVVGAGRKGDAEFGGRCSDAKGGYSPLPDKGVDAEAHRRQRAWRCVRRWRLRDDGCDAIDFFEGVGIDMDSQGKGIVKFPKGLGRGIKDNVGGLAPVQKGIFHLQNGSRFDPKPCLDGLFNNESHGGGFHSVAMEKMRRESLREAPKTCFQGVKVVGQDDIFPFSSLRGLKNTLFLQSA
jgi:hypothetical protein